MRVLGGVLSMLCALALGALDAAGAPLVIPIAGLSGGDVQVVQTLRTADGGAILLARLASSAGSSQGRVLVARLQADGALDLAYATSGIATLPVDGRALPTALAINPVRGDAWIGVSVGHGGAGQIVGLDAQGGLLRSFGSRGILALAPAESGGPAALDWRSDLLLIAAGASPCRGCVLSIRSAVTGHEAHSVTLSPRSLGGTQCGAMVATAVFAATGRETVTTETSRHGCASSLLALGGDLRPVSGAATVAGASTSLAIDGGGAQWGCIGTAGSGGVRISAYSGSSVSQPAAAPAGSLLALAPIARGACAGLIEAKGGDVVAQMASGERSAVTDRVPSGVAASAIFRCHQHLLVVGSTGSPGHRAAVVLAVAVRRGGASAAAGTGCR